MMPPGKGEGKGEQEEGKGVEEKEEGKVEGRKVEGRGRKGKGREVGDSHALNISGREENKFLLIIAIGMATGR